MFFDNDKEIKRFWEKGIVLTSADDAIRAAIVRAAGDFTARTEKRKDNSGEQKLSERLQDSQRDCNLKERLKQYFNNPPFQDQTLFNNWHHDTCQWILNVENEMYEDVSYGKAQKILNMVFKNLYCTQFGQNNKAYFRCCHIALDSFTLQWIFRNIYPKYKEMNVARLSQGKTPSWSKFTYESRYDKHNKEIYSYPFIVEIITLYFDTFSSKLNAITPFEAEFIIWKNIQMELATEAFYAQSYSYLDEVENQEKTADFKKRPLIEKLKMVKTLLDENSFS